MAKVAVTGGAGFLGSNIAKGLIKNGRSVSIIDNLSSGSSDNLNDLGIKQEVINGDLKDYNFAKSAIEGCDTVYHFAAEVGNVVYLHGSKLRELAAMQANMVMDANVFRACVENGVKKIIYASSVAVYPFDEQMGPSQHFKEEDSERKVNPEGGYGWSKYIGEKQLSFMSDIHVGIVRMFHVYGANIYLKPDRSQVMASLMRKAINYPKEDFIVWGDGTQKRCFVYIEDVLDALFKLDEYVETNGNLTINVGSHEETSVGDLAKLIVGISGKDIKMKFDTSKPTGVLTRMANLERAEKTIGWKPTTTMSVGVAKTYEWAKDRVSRT